MLPSGDSATFAAYPLSLPCLTKNRGLVMVGISWARVLSHCKLEVASTTLSPSMVITVPPAREGHVRNDKPSLTNCWPRGGGWGLGLQVGVLSVDYLRYRVAIFLAMPA